MRSTSVALLAALMLIQLTALGVGLLSMQRFADRIIIAETREQVASELELLRDDFRSGGIDHVRHSIDERLRIPGSGDRAILLRDSHGRTWGGGLPVWPATISPSEQWRVLPLYRAGAAKPQLIGIATIPLSKDYSLLVGNVLDDEARLARAGAEAALSAVAVGFVIAALCALLILRWLQARIDEFTEVAAAVEGGDLKTRWARTLADDAFDRLGAAINAMLDRVEQLVSELRMVTDSVAHDLRSPVTRLKANLEQGMVAVDDPGAREAFASAIEEADNLHHMLDTALDITRAEAGIGKDQFTAFSLPEMLDDIADVYGPLAEERGFRIEVRSEGSISVFAHRDMLLRALSNLVDNALKYASSGNCIQLGAILSGNLVRVTVADDGPGIPEARRQEALQRFGRLDKARTSSGAGLGLSLVQTIAQLHGGEVQLDAISPHGLLVTLLLPILRQENDSQPR